MIYLSFPTCDHCLQFVFFCFLDDELYGKQSWMDQSALNRLPYLVIDSAYLRFNSCTFYLSACTFRSILRCFSYIWQKHPRVLLLTASTNCFPDWEGTFVKILRRGCPWNSRWECYFRQFLGGGVRLVVGRSCCLGISKRPSPSESLIQVRNFMAFSFGCLPSCGKEGVSRSEDLLDWTDSSLISLSCSPHSRKYYLRVIPLTLILPLPSLVLRVLLWALFPCGEDCSNSVLMSPFC